jgi:3-hydroxy-3-methylglutaryl CoA synthase
MTGIVSFGGYVPFYRLDRKLIFKAVGWINASTASLARGEKAVANYDEDALTMAVAAGKDCLRDIDVHSLGGIYLASTSLPYRERLNAGIVADALNLLPNSRNADFASCLKAGSTAVLSAFDGIAAGNHEKLLVCAADCRLGKIGSPQEHMFGDGAASLLLGKGGVVAEFLDSYSLSYDFMDRWRSWDDKFDRQWEERFNRNEGYSKIIYEAISGFFKKSGIKPSDISKLICPSPTAREQAGIAKKLGIDPEKVHDNMVATVGDSGAAYSLMMLVAALQEAEPNDKILMASYGNGCDVLCFQVTDEIKKTTGIMGIKGYLEQKTSLPAYEKYTVFRNTVPQETGIRGELENATAFSHLWRERNAVHGLIGSKCTKCGTPQFPPQRVCVNPDCGAIDNMEDYSFADKKGKVFTYTGDMLAYSIDPPAIYGLVDVDGGGRLFIDFTDCRLEDLEVDMSVQMSFRRKYYDSFRGIHGYFWKAVPVNS